MKFRGHLQLALALALAFGPPPVLAQDGQGTSPLSVQKGGTGAGTASGARTNLGLGSMATQNAGAVAITGGAITGMASPTNPTDVANKSYVDATAAGLNILAPSTLASAAVLPNTPTYANGASGVGATLTAGSNTTLTVDGTAAPLNTVVLVKNQASAFQNGVFTVTQAGSGAAPWILTRASYFDQAAEMKAGSYTFITAGSTNANSSWTLQTAVATVGTDPLNFVLFSAAGISSVAITAGAGASVSGPCSGASVINCQINPTQLNVLGRLTLASGVPVMTATSCSGAQCVGKQTLYFAPDGGYTIPVFDGSVQRLFQFTSSATDQVGLSLSLAGSASWPAASCFDVFYAYVSGALYFGTGPAWSTCAGASAARGYSLTKYNGVPTNAALMTLRDTAAHTIAVPANQATLLGTIATDAATAGQITYQLGYSAAGGGGSILNVWNYWDRKKLSTNVVDSTLTWQSNVYPNSKDCDNSSTYRHTFVSGLGEDDVDIRLHVTAGFVAAPAGQVWTNYTGINLDVSVAGTTNNFDFYGSRAEYSVAAYGPAGYEVSGAYTNLIGQHFIQCGAGGENGGAVRWTNAGGSGQTTASFFMNWRN